MIFYTADEHYDHFNSIKQNNRPFTNTDEMNHALITNHNSVVTENDLTYHLGDFTLKRGKGGYNFAQDIIRQLNGLHTFIRGSHEYWAKKLKIPYMIEEEFPDCFIVMCHYALRTWPRSHYNSWNLHGHSHGKLEPVGKQWDVGVDTNNFFPYSLDQIKAILSEAPDNFNYIPGTEWRRKK